MISAQAGFNKCIGPDGAVTYSDKICPSDNKKDTISGEWMLSNKKALNASKEGCSKIHKFAQLAASRMKSGLSYDDAVNGLNNRHEVKGFLIEVLNQIYSYRASDTISSYRVASLVYGKCIAGGFNQYLGKKIVNGSSPSYNSRVSSGTGFVAARLGIIMTNQHVIDKCQTITVHALEKHYPARIIAINKKLDIALLEVKALNLQPVTFQNNTALGEVVTVSGFPLPGILGEKLNITGGNISAVSGVRDDPSRIQITAEIQPGNSGGPIFNKYGEVVGIVESKIKESFVLSESGSLPQNINFGVKAEYAVSVLKEYELKYNFGDSNISLDRAEISKIAQKATVFIKCEKH